MGAVGLRSATFSSLPTQRLTFKSMAFTPTSTLTGASTGDTLLGTAADQLIQGSTGPDSISTTFTNTSVVAESGNDSIVALGNSSTLKAGSGADSIRIQTGLTATNISTNENSD